MRRFLRFIRVLIITLLLLAGALAVYLLSGTSTPATQASYTVSLPDPAATTLEVSLTITPTNTPFLDLYLHEPVQDGHNRVSTFSAQRVERRLASWQAVPGFRNVRRVWNGFSRQPLTITYQVDPRWMKGPESPRSFVGPDFGYLRGMVVLYSPIARDEILKFSFDTPSDAAGSARLDFQLPEGWQVVSPFGASPITTPAAFLRNAYIGLGPFDVQKLEYGQSKFILGIYQGLPAAQREALVQQIPEVYKLMLDMTGFEPQARTAYWSLAIFPTEPIHGGAAGTCSLVVEDDMAVIAHEMFHWWNGSTLLTTPDANWLGEGFTHYYAIKTMRLSGIWEEAEFFGRLEGYQGRLWPDGKQKPVNLVENARRLAKQNDPAAYDPVYYGGAVLAYNLDQALAAQGKSLDDVWPVLVAKQHKISTQDFLEALAEVGGAQLAQQTRRQLNGELAIDRVIR